MSDDTVQDAPVAGEIVHYDDEIGMERLQRAPIFDRINDRQLDLIKRTIAVGEGDQVITNAEIGHFLELCALYGLDPFAREAWIAKSKTGKLLIMVGRDGIRRIVQRNGLEMLSDVVRKDDEFGYELLEDEQGHPFHKVTHKVNAFERGPIVGAWARVYERKTKIERGFFVAPLSEYKPANASPYSPWSKQESAMMVGAVERQAGREATPLGGLLMEGEDESANAQRTVGAGEGSGEDPGWPLDMDPSLVFLIEGVMARADKLGHAGLGTGARGPIQMKLGHQQESVITAWLEDAESVLDAIEDQQEPPEAEVVAGPEPEPQDGGEQAALDVDGES